MRTKLTIFAIFAFLIGFGVFWNIKNGIQVASVYVLGLANQTAAVQMTQIPIEKSDNATQAETTTQNDTDVKKEAITVSSTTESIPKKSNEISVIIGGDVMLDRAVRQLGEKNGYESLFTSVTPLFNDADIVAINLEGPITSSSSKTLLPDSKLTKSFAFTFDPKTAEVLAAAHIKVVSLANNHTDNFGSKGFEESKKYLTTAGIQWFGNPWNKKPLDTIVSANGGNIAFVGYHAFQTGFPGVVTRVKELSKQGNFVIVMPHWGEEYSDKASDKMKAQARELVSAGANAIIGSHSHVIGEMEWIGAVPVYYSLGNLLFDQYFSPETMKGELVKLNLIVKDGKTTFDKLEVIEVSNTSRKGIDVINN